MRWKMIPLDGVLSVALIRSWKGDSHDYPIRETVQPAEIPGWVDARGDSGVPWLAPQAGPCGAAARDDDAQAGPGPRSLCGSAVCGRRAAAGRGIPRCAFCQEQHGAHLEVPLASGDAHLGMHFAAPLVVRLDQADPIVILAGVHIGCFELFGTERVRAIRDLKGKTVAVPDLQTGPITFLASMVAYVGLDPRKDITWVTHPRAEAKQLLAEGKIDAF